MGQKKASQTVQCWDAVWTNANLATMSDGYGTIEKGALAIQGGKIVWVGPMAELPPVEALEHHDAAGMWITPGLIDCHTHLVYGGQRANEFAMRLQGKSYAEIAKAGGGILSTVEATRAASEEALQASAMGRIKQLIDEGVTTVEIKSGYGLSVENECKMLRVARNLGRQCDMRVVTTLLGAHAVPPEFLKDADGYVDLVIEKMLPAVVEEGLADAVDAFCESIGFTIAQTQRVFDAAKQYGLPVKLHAEQLSDMGGAQLAADYGALSADHLEYVSEEGVQAMASAGTVAVLLPGAFYFLKETKKPPIDAFRKAGVPMAIATDSNPGSSPTASLLLMLNMACTFFGLTPEEALAGVTKHAAKALGMQDQIGQLRPGFAADFVLWHIGHPDELSYRFGDRPSLTRVVAGQIPLH